MTLKLSLSQLEYVMAVEEEGSFSLAARKCHVTQPTLSQQVQKLEESLGVVVFDRSKKPIVATPLGKLLLIKAKEVVTEARRLEDIARESKEGVAGVLRVGVIPTIGPYLLPDMVKSYLEKYPQVNLKIEELQTAHIVEKLKRDQLDVGLMASPTEADSMFSTIFISKDLFWVLVSKDHPLFQRKFLYKKDLPVSELLLLSEGHCLRDHVLDFCRSRPHKNAKEFRTRFELESGSLSTLIRLVERGEGLTLIPSMAISSLSREQQLLLRPLKDDQAFRDIQCFFHRKQEKRSLVESFAGAALAAQTTAAKAAQTAAAKVAQTTAAKAATKL